MNRDKAVCLQKLQEFVEKPVGAMANQTDDILGIFSMELTRTSTANSRAGNHITKLGEF